MGKVNASARAEAGGHARKVICLIRTKRSGQNVTPFAGRSISRVMRSRLSPFVTILGKPKIDDGGSSG
jgi:hypothetical protein